MSEESKIPGSPLSAEDFDRELTESYNESVELEKIIQENKKMNAKISNQRLKMQSKEFERVTRIQENLENEDLTSRSFSKETMLKDLEDRKNAVVFVNERISEDFIAAPGSLIVVPSMTNNGKSTLTAHVAEALVNAGKKVLILSNEEKEEDVRARISCLRTTVSFGDYKTNKCNEESINKVFSDAEFLANNNQLVVVSTKTEDDAYKVTTVNGVMTTLKKAKGHFDAVLIDYYGNVNMSEMGAIEPWHVNNRLASELNIFKDTAPFPIVVFAQCEGIRSEKKVDRKENLDFESNHPMYRWKGGKNILLYATDIIELVKDFENSYSILYAHKVRFGHGDLQRKHMLPFDKKMQRFIKWTPEWDASVMVSKTVRTSQEKIEEKMKDVFKPKE